MIEPEGCGSAALADGGLAPGCGRLIITTSESPGWSSYDIEMPSHSPVPFLLKRPPPLSHLYRLFFSTPPPSLPPSLPPPEPARRGLAAEGREAGDHGEAAGV